MAIPKTRHRKRNLIFLVYPINTCYTKLQTEIPQGVTVDTRERTWTFGNSTFPIGQRRTPFYPREGLPIGVYDKTKFAHLQAMKEDSEDIARGPASIED